MNRLPWIQLTPVAILFQTLAAAGVCAQDWFKAPLLLDDVPGDIRLAGDVDVDGDIDCLRFYGTSFTVLANDGHSRFAAGASYPLPDMGGHVLFADFDGDGDGDVIVSTLTTAPTSAGLLVFPGAAGATFASPVHVTLGGNVTSLATGNANGDAIPDVAVIHFSPGTATSVLRWIPGRTDRAFAPSGALTLTAQVASDLAAFDTNGDSIDDLVYVDGLLNPVTIVFCITTGGVPAATGPVFPLASNYGFDIAVSDIDSDGDQDLVAQQYVNIGSSILSRFINSGNGAWSVGPVTALGSARYGTWFPCDWDGDGDEDLLFRQSDGGSSSVTYHECTLYRNDGAGSYTASFGFTVYGSTQFEGGVGTFDLNGDGHTDFVDNRSVYCGDGTMATPVTATGLPFGAVDWEGDGDLDIPLFDGELLVNDGRGVFASRRITRPAPPSPNHFFGTEVLVHDLDGDGLREVLVPLFVRQFVNSSVFVEMHRFEDTGSGGYVDLGAAAAPSVQITGLGFVDDVDLDGDLDFVNAQGIWLNNGAQSFASSGPSPFPNWIPIAMGDIDADGDEDFLATPLGGAGAALLRHSGPMSYVVEVLSAPNGSAVGSASAALADLDRDQDLDVVCKTGQYTLDAVIFANQGGVFTAAANLTLPSGGRLLATDVDQDGATDLAVSDDQRLAVRRRNALGFTYDPPVTFASPMVTQFADIDQDGDPDGLGAALLNRRFDGLAAGRRRQYGAPTSGAGGRMPVIGSAGVIRTGTTTVLRVREGVGGGLMALVVGSAPANISNFVIPGLTLYTQPILFTIGGQLGGANGQPGAGQLDLVLALPLGQAGLRLCFQAIVFDAAAVNSVAISNGLEVIVGQ